MTRRFLAVVLAALFTALPAALSAQPATGAARLSVSVVDTTGAVIPGATVTIVGLESSTKAAAAPTAKTNDKGLAGFDALVPGRYSITGEFPGFDLGLVRDVRLRAGENRHVIVLPIKKIEESVTVGADAQAAASTRAGTDFGLSLANDQISALSDDPAEALQQLNDLAGPNAVIRIDSFEGQQLPPKSQIKSIHVTRDQFAAETPQPGNTFVDVITQPGIGPIRGTATGSFRDGSLSAASPFTGAVGPERLRNYAANIGGAIVHEKSNFSLGVNGRDEYNTPLLNAATPDGTRSEVLSVRQPHTVQAVNGILDYALTKDQTLRLNYSQNLETLGNLGVGGFSLPEHGFNADERNYSFRALEAGPLGRRAFINTRVQVGWFDEKLKSATDAATPTIVVQDAFTSGGAQQTGSARGRQVQFASDIDFIRGINSWRTGVILYQNHYSFDENSNYYGTYYYSSLATYPNQPLLYTRQTGNPSVGFDMLYGGAYLQDDMRVRKNLTLSMGLRYSWFDIGDDHLNIQPRVGVTWSPFKNGKTTIRSSFGTFPTSPNTYIMQQTRRFDGAHQQEIDIINPSYPDPGAAAASLSNKYVIGDYTLERDIRYSGGIDERFSPRFSTNVIYNYYHATRLQRGANLNAPVNGVRPDPGFANVIAVQSDGEIVRHEVYVNFNFSFLPPNVASGRQLFNWRRLTVNGEYSYIYGRRDVLGPFDVPASGNLSDEWGNAPARNPYRVNVNVASSQVRNLQVTLAVLATAGNLYNETTGLDGNEDGLLNDRPAGVGIFSLRGAGQFAVNGRATYTIPLRTAQSAGASQEPARYRIGVYVNVTNLTDHKNYGGYSGVQTSPFFEQPTLVINPRKVDMGLNISF